MAERPCKPGTDVKGIWQLLLPDTPFPACGTQEQANAGETPADRPPAAAKRGDERPQRRD
jgi:hypothetical protein